MPPDGYSSITVSDDVLEQLGAVMVEYDCDSPAEAIDWQGDRFRSQITVRSANITVCWPVEYRFSGIIPRKYC